MLSGWSIGIDPLAVQYSEKISCSRIGFLPGSEKKKELVTNFIYQVLLPFFNHCWSSSVTVYHNKTDPSVTEFVLVVLTFVKLFQLFSIRMGNFLTFPVHTSVSLSSSIVSSAAYLFVLSCRLSGDIYISSLPILLYFLIMSFLLPTVKLNEKCVGNSQLWYQSLSTPLTSLHFL
jgi:hypothetical protein